MVIEIPLKLNYNNIAVAVLCVKYSSSIHARLSDTYHATIPLDLVQEKGVEAVLVAALASYIASTQGYKISRHKGLDTLLYLTGTRNVREVLEQYKLREGEDTVLVMVDNNRPRLAERLAELKHIASTCKLRTSSARTTIAEIALFPLDAKVYSKH